MHGLCILLFFVRIDVSEHFEMKDMGDGTAVILRFRFAEKVLSGTNQEFCSHVAAVSLK